MSRSHLDRVFVIDIEATCWQDGEQGDKPNEIIEIGICQLNMATMAIEKPMSIGVKPRWTAVSEFCTELTGWTQEKVNHGMDISDAIPYVQDQYGFKSRDIWFSCGQYDRQKLAPYGGGSIGELYGIQGAANPFVKMQHMNVKTLFALKHLLRKEMGMDRMLKHIGEILEGRHHNGMDDAVNIAKIVKHVLS